MCNVNTCNNDVEIDNSGFMLTARFQWQFPTSTSMDVDVDFEFNIIFQGEILGDL